MSPYKRTLRGVFVTVFVIMYLWFRVVLRASVRHRGVVVDLPPFQAAAPEVEARVQRHVRLGRNGRRAFHLRTALLVRARVDVHLLLVQVQIVFLVAGVVEVVQIRLIRHTYAWIAQVVVLDVRLQARFGVFLLGHAVLWVRSAAVGVERGRWTFLLASLGDVWRLLQLRQQGRHSFIRRWKLKIVAATYIIYMWKNLLCERGGRGGASSVVVSGQEFLVGVLDSVGVAVGWRNKRGDGGFVRDRSREWVGFGGKGISQTSVSLKIKIQNLIYRKIMSAEASVPQNGWEFICIKKTKRQTIALLY